MSTIFVPQGPTIPADINVNTATFCKDVVMMVDLTVHGNVTLGNGVLPSALSLGNASGTVGFFGATPVVQQSSTGITTVAQVVTVLQAYGLLTM